MLPPSLVYYTFIIYFLILFQYSKETIFLTNWFCHFFLTLCDCVTLGDYEVTFWVPVPNKWCIGIAHQGKWNEAKNMTYKQAVEIKWSLFTRQSFYRHEMSSFVSATCWPKTSSMCKCLSMLNINCVSRIDRFMQAPSIQSIHTLLLKLSSYGLFKKFF